MEYKKQESDFVKRTKEIIVQYETSQLNTNQKYEVTLFINCFVGLIIIPKEHWFKGLPDELLNNDWGINKIDVIFIKENESLTVKNITKHIRNAISHYNFKVYSNSNNQIDRVKFEDFLPGRHRTKTFEATISFDKLRIFAEKLSTEFLNAME